MSDQFLDDFDLGSALHDLASLKTDSETLGKRARALVLGQQPQPSELDQVRADIDRTARVAQAMSESQGFYHDDEEFNGEQDKQTKRLLALLARERELAQPKAEANDNDPSPLEDLSLTIADLYPDELIDDTARTAIRLLRANANLIEEARQAGIEEGRRLALSDFDRWPTVLAFARVMMAKLDENKHKGGWSRSSAKSLLRRIPEETKELEAALTWESKGDFERAGVCKEAADIANFAMMIADNEGDLMGAAARAEAAKKGTDNG